MNRKVLAKLGSPLAELENANQLRPASPEKSNNQQTSLFGLTSELDEQCLDEVDEDYNDEDFESEEPSTVEEGPLGFSKEEDNDEYGEVSYEEDDFEEDEDEATVDDGGGWKEIAFEELEVGRQIGGGGVGIVYDGWWGEKPAALKTLFDSRVDEQLKQEFMDELLVMSKLSHPNVVELYGACVQPPNLCICMELCSCSLFDMLHKQQTYATDGQRVRMAIDVAAGMNYLHELKPAIIHRDLKSANVLVSDSGTLKLCDFGLVRTRITVAGTPAYMAPELLQGAPFSKSVDVYAFGIIACEIFASQVRLLIAVAVDTLSNLC